MKKIVLVVTMICVTGIISGAFAQQKSSEEERKMRFEKFNAEREAIISKAMKLTDEEKKAFWALANELQMKKFELNRSLREETQKINRAKRANQSVAEAVYKKAIELRSRVKIEEAKLEQEYLAKFLKVIPAEKVFLYQSGERNFGERIIRERMDRSQRLSENAKGQKEKAKIRTERTKERSERLIKRAKEQAKKAEIQAEKTKKHSERLIKQAELRAEKVKQRTKKAKTRAEKHKREQSVHPRGI